MKTKNIQLIWLRATSALKADAQNSYLGSLWWVLEPILLSSLLYLAFTSGLKGANQGNLFAFLIFGMIPLKWTQSCILAASKSISSNRGIIGQVYLAKWIFPVSQNISQLIRFLFVLPLLFFISANTAEDFTIFSQAAIIAIVTVHLILNLGISLLFSSVTPIIPDLSHLVPMISMSLMFTSGVFFDINDRPEHIQAILGLNPMVNILNGYRDIFMHNTSPPFETLLYPFAFGLVTLLISLLLLKAFDQIYPKII